MFACVFECARACFRVPLSARVCVCVCAYLCACVRMLQVCAFLSVFCVIGSLRVCLPAWVCVYVYMIERLMLLTACLYERPRAVVSA